MLVAQNIVGSLRDALLAYDRQAAAVIAENDLHMATSTELILESRALLARMAHLFDEYSFPTGEATGSSEPYPPAESQT